MGFKGRSNLHAGVNQDSLLFVLLKVLAYTLSPLILTNEIFKTSTIKLIFYMRIWGLERLSEKLKPVIVDLNTQGPLVVSWVSLPPPARAVKQNHSYGCEVGLVFLWNHCSSDSGRPRNAQLNSTPHIVNYKCAHLND